MQSHEDQDISDPEPDVVVEPKKEVNMLVTARSKINAIRRRDKVQRHFHSLLDDINCDLLPIETQRDLFSVYAR